MHFFYDWHKNHKCEIVKDIEYSKGDLNNAKNLCTYTGRRKLDIFIPEKNDRNRNENFPIIIYFHGGGLMLGNKKDAYGTCKYLADQGYLVFNVDYRLTPKYKFPTQLQDTAEAIFWIYKHGKKYGGDIEKIFLSGDSAGAYLASWYSTALYNEEIFSEVNIHQAIPRPSLKGSLYFYGVFDWESVTKIRRFFNIKLMAKNYFGAKPGTEKYKKIARISSVIQNTTNEQSPVFLASSKRDRIHGQSENYAKKLRDKNIKVETLFFDKINFKKGNHGFLGYGDPRCREIAMTEAIKFIEKYIH
ncbi:alpha/beta hydrolase [Patescibacteria group bacterium]|nr:alpha/beta hydrolase [Patescibacteria group bacterium]